MSTLVLYYSNTGNTRKVATGLAHELHAELGEITCPRYESGLGPLAMAWDIFTGGTPPIEISVPANRSYDLVVVGGPVWAARPAPPVRSYLKSQGKPGNIGLFVTCSGTSPKYPPERAIKQMIEALGTEPVSAEIFREAGIKSGSFAAQAVDFAERLKMLAGAAA